MEIIFTEKTAESGWYPIETAPYSTHIIVANDKHSAKAVADDLREGCDSKYPARASHYYWYELTTNPNPLDVPLSFRPTHWWHPGGEFPGWHQQIQSGYRTDTPPHHWTGNV